MAKSREESAVAICLQVLLPYLLAGLGMVLAGMVLDYVQVRERNRSDVPGNGIGGGLSFRGRGFALGMAK